VSERRFTFIGVTTGGSSIMRIFPRWRDALGLGVDVQLVGHDIPLGAPPERYRRAVEELIADPDGLGALVTTHKIGVYEAAKDLFGAVDELAELCGELSCIAKREGRLLGWAKDPIAAGRSLEGILSPGHFRDGGGHALCMGAGGSGTAIAVYLAARRAEADRPTRLVVTDRSTERLARLEATLGRLDTPPELEVVRVGDSGTHDRLLAELPPRSLVVNATGMGKDLPGSPLGAEAPFPEGAVAWELNYRGELEFLGQARRQATARGLRVEDGWSYFIHGWATVMEEVFERPIAAEELELLAREAAFARPRPEEEER
jgi:shikimate dehydrogenase